MTLKPRDYSSYTLDDLKVWDEKICAIARDHGLDWHEITYET